MSTSSAESSQTIYIEQPKIKPIFLINTNRPPISLQQFNPPSFTSSSSSSSSSITSITNQPLIQAIPLIPITTNSLITISPKQTTADTLISNDSSKLSNDQIKEKNEKLLNEFQSRLNNMIDVKLDSFTKWINTLTFENASRCGKSYKDIKHNKISNNHLNKLARLNDLIDVNKFKNKKNNYVNNNDTKNNNKRINNNTDKLINGKNRNDGFIDEQSLTDLAGDVEMIESRRKSVSDDFNVPPSSPTFSSISDLQPSSITSNSNSSSLLIDNIIPVLTITSEDHNGKPAVILTWNLYKINEEQYIDSKDPFLSTIKEYEIHGYKEGKDHLKDSDNKIPWAIVSSIYFFI